MGDKHVDNTNICLRKVPESENFKIAKPISHSNLSLQAHPRTPRFLKKGANF
jgi:hypothetical protein